MDIKLFGLKRNAMKLLSIFKHHAGFERGSHGRHTRGTELTVSRRTGAGAAVSHREGPGP